jgi:TPP-dependent indolepyruvate ferredoxin oxidoreductase alpha subunit
MKGSVAIAKVLCETAQVVYTVPGYPVTEIGSLSSAITVINEKTALEYALGDSLSGRRAAVIVKHVGMNALADPLINATTQGLISGVVIIVGDDPKAINSQNAQDSRYYGEIAQCPVIEPDESCIQAAITAAFEVSERFSRVVILRVTPPLLDAEVELVECIQMIRRGSLANPALTIAGRVTRAEKGTAGLFTWAARSPLNRISDDEIGVGPAGGTSRIVISYPPPPLPSGARIIEIGRPFVREHQSLLPPAVRKNSERFTDRGFFRTFCPDCPFKPLLSLLKEDGLKVIPDIGCSFLSMNPPYSIGVASYGLGSSIAVAAKSTKIALIGDGALLHSGINSLIDCRERGIPLLCIVLKNNCMAMTGGQLAYDPVRYLGFADPLIISAGDLPALRAAITIPVEGPRIVIVEGSCPEVASYEKVEC